MFAREVTVTLKSNSKSKFIETIENEITPILRKEKGFNDMITLVSHDGAKAVAISLWEQKENAEAYKSTTYPKVVKALEQVVSGTPMVKTYEVSNSTMHKIAVPQPA